MVLVSLCCNVIQIRPRVSLLEGLLNVLSGMKIMQALCLTKSIRKSKRWVAMGLALSLYSMVEFRL